MDDLIRRQEAITLPVMSKKYRKYQTYNLDDAYEQGWIDLQKCIEKLPPAQPEMQWIPCSEETGDGYPEEDGLYYVTEQNYGFYLDAECKQRVTHTSHFKNGDFTDRFYTENNSNITAWMPLPEAYKEEKDETN